jgi:uncharacterized membrane protein
MDYMLVKYLHILSATVLFGTGIGTAFQMWFAHRGGDVSTIAHVAKNVVIADYVFTTPAVIVQPVTGIALALMAGFDPLTPWLIATYLLYALAGLCWLPVVWLQIRIRDLAHAAAQTNSRLPEAYYRTMRLWFILGWPAFAAVAVIFWLMITKPILW